MKLFKLLVFGASLTAMASCATLKTGAEKGDVDTQKIERQEMFFQNRKLI